MLYKVIRMYADRNKRTHTVPGKTGLYLEEVQRHCNDPETSSTTCQKPAGRARTRKYGPWFDGYTEDK